MLQLDWQMAIGRNDWCDRGTGFFMCVLTSGLANLRLSPLWG